MAHSYGKHTSLKYIGYSLGGVIGLHALTKDPTLQDKVTDFIALASCLYPAYPTALDISEEQTAYDVTIAYTAKRRELGIDYTTPEQLADHTEKMCNAAEAETDAGLKARLQQSCGMYTFFKGT